MRGQAVLINSCCLISCKRRLYLYTSIWMYLYVQILYLSHDFCFFHLIRPVNVLNVCVWFVVVKKCQMLKTRPDILTNILHLPHAKQVIGMKCLVFCFFFFCCLTHFWKDEGLLACLVCMLSKNEEY